MIRLLEIQFSSFIIFCFYQPIIAPVHIGIRGHPTHVLYVECRNNRVWEFQGTGGKSQNLLEGLFQQEIIGNYSYTLTTHLSTFFLRKNSKQGECKNDKTLNVLSLSIND